MLKKKKFSCIFILIFCTFIFCSCGSSKSNIETDDPEKAYLMAKSKYDRRDYLDAIDDFNLIKLKFSGTSIIDKAIYYLGMSYYKREEFILAAYEFEVLIKSYPTSRFAEDSRYRLAMCYYQLSPAYNLDQTYTRYAINDLQNFLDLYPHSKFAVEADRRIHQLKNKLALKEYRSAELYFTLGKYKSALVYYDAVLNEFFDTDYADDALYGKIQTLIVKKLYGDAKREIVRFEEKFTSSQYLPRVLTLKRQIPL